MLFLFLCSSYSKDFKLCFECVNSSPYVRFAISDRIRCADSTFVSQSSSKPGGAIFVNHSSSIFEVDSCLFFKCASLGSEVFNGRVCSGGAICCSLLYGEVLKSSFDDCFGSGAGTAVFMCGDSARTQKIEDSALSKMSCMSKASTEYSGIVACMLDRSSSEVERVNFSQPRSLAHALFFGKYPSKITAKSVAVVGSNAERGIELSSYVSSCIVNSILFVDMIATQGIFAVWESSFAVSDIHVINCKGKLAYQFNNGMLQVSKSWIGKDISVDAKIVTLDSDTVKEDSSIKITKIIEYQILNICSFRASRKFMSLFVTLFMKILNY